MLDDDKKELHKTSELLSLYGETHPQYKLEITCFHAVKPFMDAVVCSGDGKEKWTFDILLMDVYLPEWEWHKECGNPAGKGYQGVIIFKSSSEEHVLDSFSVGALQYLIKPVSREKLFGTIEKAVKKSALMIKEEPDVQPGNDGGDETSQTYSSFLNNIMKWIQRKIE